MEATTSSVLQLLPGQFEQLHVLFNSFTFSPDTNFGLRETFWIRSHSWFTVMQDNKECHDQFFAGIQKILQTGQEFTIQCIAGKDLSFPFRALQVKISSLFVEIDGF